MVKIIFKKKIIVVAVLALLAVIILAGVFGFLKRSPEQVMRKMIKEMTKVKTLATDFRLGIYGQFPDLINPDETRRRGEGSILISLAGDVDYSSQSAFDYALNGKVSYKMSQEKLEAVGNVLSKNNEVFFQLLSVPEVKAADLKSLEGNWYKLGLTEMLGSSPLTGEEKIDLAKMKKIRKLINKTDVLEITADNGIDSLKEIRAHHYNIKLNKNKAMEFFKAATKIQDGREMTELEIAELELSLEDWSQFIGSVWIGEKDFKLYKVEITGQVERAEGVKRFNFAMDLSGFNKLIYIMEPKTVRDFDLAKVLAPEFDYLDLKLDKVENGDVLGQLPVVEGVSEDEMRRIIEEIENVKN